MNKTEIITQLVLQIALPLLAALVSLAAAWLGKQLAKIKKSVFCSEEAERVARSCVLAAEQMYGAGGGKEKMEKALSFAETLLKERGIDLSREQLTVLAEAALAELNGAFERESGHAVD